MFPRETRPSLALKLVSLYTFNFLHVRDPTCRSVSTSSIVTYSIFFVCESHVFCTEMGLSALISSQKITSTFRTFLFIIYLFGGHGSWLSIVGGTPKLLFCFLRPYFLTFHSNKSLLYQQFNVQPQL